MNLLLKYRHKSTLVISRQLISMILTNFIDESSFVSISKDFSFNFEANACDERQENWKPTEWAVYKTRRNRRLLSNVHHFIICVKNSLRNTQLISVGSLSSRALSSVHPLKSQIFSPVSTQSRANYEENAEKIKLLLILSVSLIEMSYEPSIKTNSVIALDANQRMCIICIFVRTNSDENLKWNGNHLHSMNWCLPISKVKWVFSVVHRAHIYRFLWK